MSTTLNRSAYEKLVAEDLEWLEKQPDSLEHDHIELILKDSPTRIYGMWCGTTIEEIEQSVERVLHRNGLVNGHPLTVSERQGIAITTAIQQLRESATLLRTIAGQTSITAMQMQSRTRAQLLDETAEALGREFRL